MFSYHCVFLKSDLCFLVQFSCADEFLIMLFISGDSALLSFLASLSVSSSVSFLHAYLPHHVSPSLAVLFSPPLCLCISLPRLSHASVFCLLYLFPPSSLCFIPCLSSFCACPRLVSWSESQSSYYFLSHVHCVELEKKIDWNFQDT